MLDLTKAEMLEYIQEGIPSIHVLPVYRLNSTEYFQDKENEIKKILYFSEGGELIVRSSSRQEDTSEYSNAGRFESILDVMPEREAIGTAVEAVYRSYETQEEEEILIQPMLKDICKSGVVFTADMDTFADYYTVNFSEGEDTAAVTGGSSTGLKTFIRYKHSHITAKDPDIQQLLEDCRKIEVFLNCDALDIEFAVTRGHTVYILQVRPIAQGEKEELEKRDISYALKRIYKKVEKLSRRYPFLLGNETCFGVMPDWNPAEILGVRPKKLAVSLYKELITDNIWAHQRYDYGYRDLTLHPLMISFCGIPYINTRITFNSFVPAKLNVRIAEKLINYYQKKLSEYPKYHDKIEFEIVFSCYYFGVSDRLKELSEYGFNENEIKRIEYALLDVTNEIINPQNGLYKNDIRKISTLEENYEKIVHSEMSLVDKIYWLIEECKTYGTLPFAGAARAGFIAVQFLKSFVECGIITKEDYDRYMNSLNTVNKQMNFDFRKCRDGQIEKSEFLEKYGHIRPGTYDIMSPRYDEAFEEYFGDLRDCDDRKEELHFSEEVLDRIQVELEQNGLLVSVGELMEFIQEAIEGREYLKFIFTKSVSKILQLIEILGKRVDICKEDMAHLDILTVKQLYTDLYNGDIKGIFSENIKNNKEQFASAVQIKLPSLIVRPEDVYQYYLLGEEPNYITQKYIRAETVDLTERETDVEGKIVFIQAADPGYDYLFSRNIGGLVTQFGGANSHMAIRCAELGIPAIIGVGEQNFNHWKRCRMLMIDCQKKQVIPVE